MQKSSRFIRSCISGAIVACWLLLVTMTVNVAAYSQVVWPGDTQGAFSVLSIPSMSVYNGGNYTYLADQVSIFGYPNNGVTAGVIVTVGGISPGMHYFYAETSGCYFCYTFHYVGDAGGDINQLMSANIWVDTNHSLYEVDLETPQGHFGPYFPAGYNFPVTISQVHIEQVNATLDVSRSSNPWSSQSYNQWYTSNYTGVYQVTPSSSGPGNSRTQVNLPTTAGWWELPGDSTTGGIFNVYCCS